MMQVTRVKQDGTAWNFSLHYQIMGYFSHPNAVCEFPPQHTEAGREGKKNFFWPLNFLFSFFFFFCASEELGPSGIRTKLKGQENK